MEELAEWLTDEWLAKAGSALRARLTAMGLRAASTAVCLLHVSQGLMRFDTIGASLLPWGRSAAKGAGSSRRLQLPSTSASCADLDTDCGSIVHAGVACTVALTVLDPMAHPQLQLLDACPLSCGQCGNSTPVPPPDPCHNLLGLDTCTAIMSKLHNPCYAKAHSFHEAISDGIMMSHLCPIF